MENEQSYHRCICCGCHTITNAPVAEVCPLCCWPNRSGDHAYRIAEAQENALKYGVYYRPTDVRFAPARHPILGVSGAYAIDRVALRERAYREFAMFATNAGEHAQPTPRLLALLACISNADRLYTKK